MFWIFFDFFYDFISIFLRFFLDYFKVFLLQCEVHVAQLKLRPTSLLRGSFFSAVGVGPRNAGALAKFLADILGDYSANTANFKFSALSSLLRF